jgi:RNA polymerase sigma-70 factor (ECF subfamily)
MKTKAGEPLAASSLAIPIAEGGEVVSRLFAEHYRRILLASYRITGNMADAEDVAQAVFLRLSCKNRVAIENAASYLYRAAINGALDQLRRRRSAAIEPLERADSVQADRHGDSLETEASTRQLGDLLRAALGELSPRSAEIFTLRYIEELNNREIAALMKTSQAAIAVTLYNARSALKKRLRNLQEEKR